MKIIELQAENVKRIKAVRIRPDGSMVPITGKNGAGKSSVLDCIMFALSGERSIDSMPIRKGEEKASIKLDLGELTIERRFTAAGSRLLVQTKDGMVPRTPQAMLDKMVGALSFDPLEFTRLHPKEQTKMLRAAVASEVDFEQLEKRRKDLYEQRREIARDARNTRAAANEIKLPDDIPEPIDVEEIVARLREITEHNERVRGEARVLEQQERRVSELTNEHGRVRERLLALRAEYEKLKEHLETLKGDVERAKAEVKAAASKSLEVVDPRPLDAKRREAADHNQQVEELLRDRDARARMLARADDFDERAAALSKEVAAIDKAKADAIAAAKLPVEGLSWSEDGITLADIPFSQASTAEQIRTSVALAMAVNPKIRVLRIKEGSLLDRDNLALIGRLAADHDFQVWIETVESADPGAFVIEDGELRDEAAKAAAE